MSKLVIYDGYNPESMLYAGLAARSPAALWDYTKHLKLPDLEHYSSVVSFGVDFMNDDIVLLDLYASTQDAVYLVYQFQAIGNNSSSHTGPWLNFAKWIKTNQDGRLTDDDGVETVRTQIEQAVNRWVMNNPSDPCTVKDLNIASMLLDTSSHLSKPLAMAKWVDAQCIAENKPAWLSEVDYYRKRLNQSREICERTLSMGQLAGSKIPWVSSGVEYFSDVVRTLSHLKINFVNENVVRYGTLLTIRDVAGERDPFVYLNNDSVRKSFKNKGIVVNHAWSSPMGIHLLTHNRYA